MLTPLKILLSAIMFTVPVSISFAAELPDAGRLLKESSLPPSLAPQHTPPDLPQQVKPLEPKKSDTKIKVSSFTFTGNTIFSCDELSDIMAGYRNKELTLSELEIAIATVTNAYRKRGYFLASPFIPPQTVAPGGTLIIEVQEGVLEEIHVETTTAKTRTLKSVLEYYANQVPVNLPLDDGTLTAMVMRTNELPNITSRIMLEPGSRPGTTKATLQVSEGRPCSFSLNIDNYGNQTTGENHLSGTMHLYSPLRIGDQLNLRMQSSTTGNLLTVQSGYTMPLMSYGTSIGWNYSYIGYQMGGAFTSLQASGSAQNLSISLSHSLVRRRDLILNATVAEEGSLLDDRIASTGSRNQRLNTSFQAGINGIRMDNGAGGGFTSFSLGLVAGRLSIRDAETLANDQSSEGLHTDGSYTKINMALARSQPLYHGVSLYTGAYGQWSNNNLGSSEQLSLSGPGAVRAYQSSESSADRAIVSTVELRYLFASTGELPGKLELSAFIDHGYAALHTTPLPDAGMNLQSLAGAGLGIKWFDTNNYSLQSTVAWKIDSEHTAADSPLVFAQLTKSF
jgi:hemolysin activation/secretion protein